MYHELRKRGTKRNQREAAYILAPPGGVLGTARKYSSFLCALRAFFRLLALEKSNAPSARTDGSGAVPTRDNVCVGMSTMAAHAAAIMKRIERFRTGFQRPSL